MSMIANPANWNPALYARFEDERTRPARDLLAQVPLTEARLVVDMGCGPANSTELLVERFAKARVVGLDNSEAMLAAARKRLPQVEFALADARTWVPEAGTDLVFANAIYQWLGGHVAAIQRALEAMGEGGVVAVQMPDNMAEPSHVLMREVAATGPWAEKLRDAARTPLPPVRDYYEALKPHARRIDIWHTVYNHVLEGADAIVEWVQGTGLRPFLDPLNEPERQEYLQRYRQRIAEAYPPTFDGKVLLRFPRLFIVAVR